MTKDEALNKMADNARELGLDYEPDTPFGDNNPGLQWDEVPQAFNDWWNAAYDPTGNPFGKDTHAYWAWAGWKAAKQPAQQDSMHPEIKKMYEDYFDKCFRASPAAQRTWVGLTLQDRETLRDRFEGWNYPGILVDVIFDMIKEKNQ